MNKFYTLRIISRSSEYFAAAKNLIDMEIKGIPSQTGWVPAIITTGGYET